MTNNETKSLRVRILDRDYALRVREEDIENTAEVAAYLDAKMHAFKKAHPDQNELTTAVIAALAVTEELVIERQRAQNSEVEIESHLVQMDLELKRVLKEKVAVV